MTQPRRATPFTRFQTALATLVAVPVALVLALMLLSGLANALTLHAPFWFGIVTAVYLVVLVLLPRAIYRRSLTRGHDKRVAQKFAVYSILALALPLIPWWLGGAM